MTRAEWADVLRRQLGAAAYSQGTLAVSLTKNFPRCRVCGKHPTANVRRVCRRCLDNGRTGPKVAVTCRFCDDLAVAVFSMPRGCVCHPADREQALCMHHVVKATPLGGMLLKKDLTMNDKFTAWWNRAE